jgi:hypothetical protein
MSLSLSLPELVSVLDVGSCSGRRVWEDLSFLVGEEH